MKNNIVRQKGSTQSKPKGFTLLELLIVIAVLAVLATIAVLIINPVEYVRQARDSQRISDLATLKKAVDLYMNGASVAFAAANCAPTKGYVTSGATNPFASTTITTLVATSSTALNGTGWIGAIDFTTILGGSPLAKLPIDPVNSGGNFYSFACNAANNTYEMDTSRESAKYAPMELAAKDGGNNDNYYEVGNSLVF